MSQARKLLWATLLALTLLIPSGGFGHLLGANTSVALANTPACANASHNTASGQAWACSNGTDGLKYDMRCTGNLRVGPGAGYSVHGTATGTGINQYRDVYNGSAINGGCNGPTTNEWYLSSNGWVSRSITYSPYPA